MNPRHARWVNRSVPPPPLLCGAEMLLDFSISQRQEVLAVMDPETRELMLEYLNRHDRGHDGMGDCVCPKCGFKGPYEVFTGGVVQDEFV